MIKCMREDLYRRMDMGLHEVVEEVENFKYLGVSMGANGGVESDESYRVNGGCKLLVGMKMIMKKKENGNESKEAVI